MSGLPASIVAQLNAAQTLGDLASIANSPSAAATNSNGVLYSGPVSVASGTLSSATVAPNLASNMGRSAIDSTPARGLVRAWESSQLSIVPLNGLSHSRLVPRQERKHG